MKIERYGNVSKSEMFPCTIKEIKDSKLNEIESIKVCFGLSHRFRFGTWDNYDYKIPNIQGTVIAEAKVYSSINSNKNNVDFYKYFAECMFYLFPVKVQDYTPKAREDFCQTILPQIYDWFREQTSKTEIERLKNTILLVEWLENSHKVINIKSKK